MDQVENRNEDLGEHYRAMIKGHYERLRESAQGARQGPAIEEVKLRLFLSLLEKPVKDDSEGPVATSVP